MRIKVFNILLFIVITLSSCWKDEEPLVLPSPGASVQQQLTLGENYDKIIFFNVNDRQFLIRNLADWDLGFACDAGKRDVKINAGKDIYIFERSDTNFSDPYTITPGLDWKYDVPSGNADSSAVGKWWDTVTFESRKVVYLMDFGQNFSGSSRYKKFQITKADQTGYWVRMADLNGNNEISQFVPKDAKHNYSYLNVNTGEAKTDLEPEKDKWDIVFTRYRYIFQNPTIPYQVTGVLLNPNNVIAYEERNRKFEDIDLAYAMSVQLTSRADVVGYEWKTYNQNTGRYTVDLSRTYIIKTISGYYYKFRFIDFYSNTGIKGSPTFEIQRL